MRGVELRTYDGELVEGGDNPVPQGGGPDETEDRDHHEEQWVDSDEPVPAETHDELVHFIVPKFLDHPVRRRDDTVCALPTIDSCEKTLDWVHRERPFCDSDTATESEPPPIVVAELICPA